MRRLVFTIGLVICFSLLVGGAPAYAAPSHNPITYYVNDDAVGTNTGTSWQDAYTDLQSALDASVSGDQIWVAAGTYTPSLCLDGATYPRTASFSLKSGVALYGGFAGEEKSLAERSLDANSTILSGDIGTAGDDTDNSYHVIYASGVTGAVLDGFTVTGGHGNGASYAGRDSQGAGMYNYESALTVSNCIFSHNRVTGTTYLSIAFGAGMYNEDSASTVTDCVFSDNQAGVATSGFWGRGGGMYNKGSYSSYEDEWPSVTGCTFTGNYAAASSADASVNGGGGMFNEQGRPTIDSCIFAGNSAGNGGAMLNYYSGPILTNCVFDANFTTYSDGLGGAIYNVADATILNCTFYKNGWRLLAYGQPRFRPYTAYGGAIYNLRAGSWITNCIFSENGARYGGGAIYYANGRGGTLTNCLFYNNIFWWLGADTPESSHVYGHPVAFEEYGNLYDIDPLLVAPAGGDFHLGYDSPCLEAADYYKFGQVFWPQDLTATDFEGDKRVLDGDADGTPALDIGADEYVPNLPDLRVFLQGLAGDGDIDSTLEARLLTYLDAAEAALTQQDESGATRTLNKLIATARAALGDTETAQLIERKTEAVIQSL